MARRPDPGRGVPTGRGGVEPHPIRGGCVHATLYNFDIDDHRLKPEHRRWLLENVVPILEREGGGSVTIQGRADRIWRAEQPRGRAHNRRLSQLRAEATARFLRNSVDPRRHYRERTVTWTGEDPAEAAGDRPGERNDWFRSVVVTACPTPVPPPETPPPDPPPRPEPEPELVRDFKIQMVHGREMTSFFLAHQRFFFRIWQEGWNGQVIEQAVYLYRGDGVSLESGKSVTDFGIGDPRHFRTPAAVSALVFSGPAAVIWGGENGRPAPGRNWDVATALELEMRPRAFGRWRARANMPPGVHDAGSFCLAATWGRLTLVPSSR